MACGSKYVVMHRAGGVQQAGPALSTMSQLVRAEHHDRMRRLQEVDLNLLIKLASSERDRNLLKMAATQLAGACIGSEKGGVKFTSQAYGWNKQVLQKNLAEMSTAGWLLNDYKKLVASMEYMAETDKNKRMRMRQQSMQAFGAARFLQRVKAKDAHRPSLLELYSC
jgi:hypothetical protein